MGLCAALPAAVLAVGSADAAQLDLRAAAALYHQAHYRYLSGGPPIAPTGLARIHDQAFVRSWDDRDGRAVRDSAAGRVRHLLWPILPDHDGFPVQPLRLAAGAVPARRAAADGIFRSHAGGQAGQPDDDRYRRDQRNVQRRIADPVRGPADARRHHRDHVLVQCSSGAVVAVRDPAPASNHQLLPRAIAHGLSRDP